MIRLTAIRLINFKNVADGKITLSSVGCNPDEWESDIVGIYGQNGSGKTSVITALLALKTIWYSGKVPDFCEECIALGSDSFSIAVEGVACSDSDTLYKYDFTYFVEVASIDGVVKIISEKLTYKDLDEKKPSLKSAFEYLLLEGEGILRPKISWDALCAMDKNLSLNVMIAKKMASLDGDSLLMSNEFIDIFSAVEEVYQQKSNGGSLSKAAAKAYTDVFIPSKCLRWELFTFADENLSIITPSRQAEPMLNKIRISTHEGIAQKDADAYFGIDLSAPVLLRADYIAMLRATIFTISTVLGALVPGLQLGVKSLGEMLVDDGSMGESVEIVATRDGVTVPLRAESEGIKKLVSILVLLVDVYSKPAACVAIDELDSGIFEFLLGELLQVLEDHGRGQLIFTAHNLRPLETLDKTSLVFTTTNPQNRYVTFKGTKGTNNLRSQYLRAINLGGQPETIYEATSKYEIDSAFYDAGNPIN
jgi:AAA15 family ATPase/GTPase